MKEEIRAKLLSLGASAAGFAAAGAIDDGCHAKYASWIGEGYNGKMRYLERHTELRRHTDHVMDGAKTVISLAFSYVPEEWLSLNRPLVAAYAYGKDYHIVLRNLLKPATEEFKKVYGGKWRICIDSAPMAERYWALKSGIGRLGKNGNVIVEGCGSLCFLTEILTDREILPDVPSEGKCMQCGACRKVCPGKAILEDGTIDARRCINYLTIENTDDFSDEEIKILSRGSGHILGCDRCLRVCPHNKDVWPTKISEFKIHPQIKNRNLQDEIQGMSEESFNKKFSEMPLKYVGLARLKRNCEIK